MSTAAADLAIDLKDVAKTYRGRVQALRGMDLRVAKGEIFGLLGPNGAGKSTLVKILMTVIRATRCQGHMLGKPVGDKAGLARVGYLPEHHRFPDYLTGAQVLDYFAALSGVDRRTRKRRTNELLALVGMSDWGSKRVRGYSKGMRQRIGVAQALMNDPELVLLDEPTDGVDPVGRRDIRQVLSELKRQGRTVFINSHLLSELELVCDRVAILVQGAVASQGTIESLTRGQRRYIVEVAGESSGAASAVVRRQASQPGFEGLTMTDATIVLPSDDAGQVQPLIDRLRAEGVVIRAVTPHRPTLEDLFMQAVRDPASGGVLKPGAAMGAR